MCLFDGVAQTMSRILISVLLMGAAQAQAQTSTDGITYIADCNPHGAIMRDVSGQSSAIILGASCDALVEELGPGTWGNNRDGFIAVFGEKRFAFPGQDYPCGTENDPDPYFGLSCDIPK